VATSTRRRRDSCLPPGHNRCRVWVGLALYAEALNRFSIQWPWEITLALRDSRFAVLGNVAAAWADPERPFHRDELPRCPDPMC
jgi:hypothetical protein